MIICSIFGNLADLYVQGRLRPFQARLVRNHLAACPKCAAEAASWEAMFKALRGLPVPSPAPGALEAAVEAAVAAASSGNDSFSEELPEAPREESPSMVLAFSLLTFLVSVSGSIFGPGLPSQSCTDDASSVCRPAPGKSPPVVKP